MVRFTGSGAVALAWAGAMTGPAFAQVPDPTVRITPSREQVTIPPAPAPPPAAAVTVDSDGVGGAPCPFTADGLTATITAVRFVAPDQAALPPAVASLLADIRPQPGARSLREICTLRDEATARLRRAGYLAVVLVPPQQLAEGELRLTVITARLVQVRVIGEPGRHAATIAARIERLKRLDPFNELEAERILLLASDVPGLQVALTLHPAPSGRTGEVVADLRVSRSPVTVLANVQNYGSRQLGRGTGFVAANIAGLTGLADVTSIAASTTLGSDEQRVGQLGHHFGIGTGGFRLGGTGTYAISRPSITALDIKSRTIIGTVDASLPLVRSVSRTLIAAGGIDLVEQRTLVSGNPLTRDRLRVAFARLDAEAVGFGRDRSGAGAFEAYHLSASFEARRGLAILNASQRGSLRGGFQTSRPDGDPTATVLRGELDGRARLGPMLAVAGTAQGQWASNPLLNFEEYSVGNLTIGRGYDPGANSGDRAVGLRGEVRVRLPRPAVDPGHPLPLDGATGEVFGFYDNVWLWNRDINQPERNRLLRSYGGGVRLNLPSRLAFELIYAHPRDRALRNDDRPPPDRLLLSLTMKFAPGAR